MKKEIRFKFGLRAKLTGIFILFGAMILGAAILFIRDMVNQIYVEYYNESLSDIAETAAVHLKTLGIGTVEMHAYAQSGAADERYEMVLEAMQEMRERFELESLYIIYPTGEYTAAWFLDASQKDAQKLGDNVNDYADYESRHVRRAYETGEASKEMDWTRIVGNGGDGENENAEYIISAYYPIKDAQGNSVAVLGVDKTELEMKKKINSSLAQVTRMIFLIVILSTVLLILFVQIDMVRPIRRLKRSVQKFGEGESGMQFADGMRSADRRRDELGEIARTFNRMADQIGRHIGEMEELSNAYRKLLPPGIFQILHKKSIVEFQLGDQANVDLTVLAMEPKEAGHVMPGLSSEQTFQYINDMLAQTVPAVLEQGGAAWNFDQAGVYSFFQNAAPNALDAALSAGRRLQKKGERIAAGIVKGQVMVGVAGHEARMNVISISEQTNIAAFFMRIGAKYQASVLIGRSAAAQIPGFEKHYHVRFLGYLKISASERLEGVYDVYDGDEERRNKQRTKEDFERGVLLFTQQKHREAREAFIDVLRQCRGDSAAREYLGLCNRVLAGEEREDRVWFEELRERLA
ncbi:MAG: HAMP domain-containing protein [Lachnospiraceae bacterium]|nr:HAMP domain-containing protein [Lachnospiraceae bacterium]